MKNIKPVLSIFIVSFWLFSAVWGKSVVFYHTSDVHGWYFPRLVKTEDGKERSRGGFSALASAVSKEVAPVFLLDSGDLFQGTPEGTLTKGEASVKLMNALGYFASAIGNHEFDMGEDIIVNLADKSGFPFLAANIFIKGTKKRPHYARPYSVIISNGIKIAVIGFMTPETKISVIPDFVKHLDFKQPADILPSLLKEIKRKEKPNAIIALVHNGLCELCGRKTISEIPELTDKDKKYGNLRLARKAKGDIAVVFGGHYHTTLENGYIDPASKTLFAESGENLLSANRVELEFDDNTNKFLGATAKLIPLWLDKTGEDEHIAELLKEIKEETSKEMDKPVSVAEKDILRSSGIYDNDIGNWMTDVMRQYGETQIALQNTRGIRADFDKGTITARNMLQVFPFENNTLVTLELTGTQIEQVMRENLTEQGSTMQVSGISVLFSIGNDGKPSKITITIDGEPINPKQFYTVTTNNYLAGGGDGGATISKGTSKKDTLISIRGAMTEYARKAGKISAPPGGRIKKI